MSDDEISTNNSMDVDFARNDSPSSPSAARTAGVVLDLGIGTGYISGSDDDDNNNNDDDDHNSQERKERIPSKTSTPDSTTLSSAVTRKPTTTTMTKKPTLTKTKSALVNYDRDSDDDEHTEDEEEMDENNDEPDAEDNDSNSNIGNTASASEEKDPGQNEENPLNEQTIGTSDLLNVTPLRADDASPLSHGDMTANQQFIFPEDAEIRIPPQPSKSCPAKLEKKFEEYYQRLKRTGINQNALIQGMKDFRNPCMYEKIISHLGIDEIGTNFPQDLYDPHWWGKESYYEELSKAQKLEIERREQERRERTKIGFTPGVRKVDQLGGLPSSSNEPVVEKRKNRFDQ